MTPEKLLAQLWGELPNCSMGWRRTSTTSHEAVDLLLKLMLAQEGVLNVESDNWLVINCFEQHFVNIEQLNISAREQQRQAGPQGKGSQELSVIARLLEAVAFVLRCTSPTIAKQGEKTTSHDGNQRQSREYRSLYRSVVIRHG